MTTHTHQSTNGIYISNIGQHTRDTGQYTFTLNPSEQYLSSPTRLAQVTAHVKSKLHLILGTTYEYKLYTEVSHPTTAVDSSFARIHYHGFITFKGSDKSKFYIEHINLLSKYFAVEVDSIESYKYWFSYCTKDINEMSSYCEENRVPYLLKHTDLPVGDPVPDRNIFFQKQSDKVAQQLTMLSNSASQSLSKPKRNKAKRSSA